MLRKLDLSFSMKKTAFLLFVIVALFSGKASAQHTLEYIPAFHFRRHALPLFFPDYTATAISPFNSAFTVFPGKAIVEGKPYEAFFCKLEVRTERFLGFGLRIHAGDYDSDMKQYSLGD